VPQGLSPQDVVLTATSQLKIDDGSTVRAGAGFGRIANLGSGSTTTGVGPQVGNLLSNGPIFLGTNTRVNGSVVAGGTITQQTGVVITGTVTHQAVGTDSSRNVTVTFPTSAAPIVLQSGQSRTLAPGSYGNVTVNGGATLSLSAGTYLFTSLDTEPSSTLRLNESAGTVFIYVQNTLLFKGIESQTGGDGNVFVGVFGSQAVSLQAPFRGTLVAPNAEVDLTSQTAGFAGTFIGATVEVFPRTTVTGIGAVIPPQSGGGVSPTLNCVTQLNSTTLGAVFGYTNTTGANVTLGAGPHNMFAPGNADRGQPLLFVPGAVPIATFQTFPVGSSLTYTIGQQAVMASSTATACPAALATALGQLFNEDANTRFVRAQSVSILANPKFASWISATRNNLAAQLTPFEAALLDAASLAAANADLLGDPANLTAAQQARIPAFRASLLGNAAVTALRLNGDALRASPASVPCGVVDTIDHQQPKRIITALAPQAGSLFEQVQNVANQSAIRTLQATVANVARGTQSLALLAVPGLVLAAAQPETTLIGIQLSGAIPTGFLSAIGGAITGAIVGAAVGAAVGGPYGAIVGAVAGAVIGGIACGVEPEICDTFLGDTCTNCTGGASDTVTCGADGICVDGCCSGGSIPTTMTSFLSGAGCPGNGASCQRDFDCGGGNLRCVQNCCVNPQVIAAGCAGGLCSTDANCFGGNHCRFGCCIGPCGINGISCTQEPEPAMCGVAPVSCGGNVCSQGCCVVP
jgi:hypothetical protein